MTRIVSTAFLVLGIALGIGWSAGAAAAPGTGEADAWRGRYCTRPGCKAALPSPTAKAGFGAALVGAVWVARRSGRRLR